MAIIRVVIACISLFISYIVHADVVGSTSAVSTMTSSYNFPENPLLFANEIKGFVWMKNGFSLANSDTECIFNALFPISGTVDLNGGILTLQEDLRFQNGATLQGLGRIEGNNHSLFLCSSITEFPVDASVFQDISIYLDADLLIQSTITFKGVCSIIGNGKSIVLAENAALVVDTDATLSLCDLELQNIDDNNLRCADDSGVLVLNKVKLVQSADCNFAHGSILFRERVDLSGPYTFTYNSKVTSVIDANSCLNVCTDVHLCMGHDFETLNNPLAFTDKSSVLSLDNCSFIVTDSGMQFTKGTIFLSREVNLDPIGTTTSGGIILGNGNADDDITMWFAPGAAVKHNSGYWVYNNGSPYELKSSSNTARMIRNINSKIYLPKSLEVKDLTVQLNSNYVTPIQVEPTAQLSYNNASVSLPDIKCDITSDQLNAYTYCLNGNDSIFLTKGTLPIYLLIIGSGNQIRGNGGMTGGITLYDHNAYLACGINGFVDNFIQLNEGTLALGYDLLFRSNGSLVGPGVVDLGANTIEFEKGFTASSPIYWSGDGGEVFLNGKVTLSQTWTFNGNCTLAGSEAKLVLAEGGNIVVSEGSQLTIKNIALYGVKDSNLRCQDDESSISFIRGKIYQSDDFLFDKGSMKFFLNNLISGSYTFSYDTVHTSTIQTDGTLKLQDGVTLALGRKNGVEPLCFQDSTATLDILNASLRVDEQGAQFTKGSVIADGKVNMDFMGTTTSTGFIVGNGNSEEDLKIVLRPGCILSHNSGYWVYNNGLPDRIYSTSIVASLIRDIGSLIYIPHTLNITNLSVQLLSEQIAPVLVDEGTTINYDHARIKLPTVDFEMTAQQYNSYTYALQGSDEMFFTKGTLPLYLLVSGVDNYLRGNGGLTGAVIFANSSAELRCAVRGFIDNIVTLNGGMLILERDLSILSNSGIVGPGICDLDTNKLTISIGTFNSVYPICWKGNNGTIDMQGQLSLSSTWTFNGKCIVDGNSNRIVLNEGAELVVDTDSQLVLKNAEIHGLSDTNIHCANAGGRITFINCNTYLDQDYSFTVGSLQFYRKNYFTGPYTFSYDSPQTSTIKNDAQLIFKDDVTFVAGRNSGVEPLEFENSSSIIKFDNAAFRIKPTGMRLTKGKAVTDRDVEITVLSDSFDTGLTFGDGTADGDMKFIMNPGCTVRYPAGAVTFDVTALDAIRSKSKTAAMIRGSESAFYLKHHLLLADVTVDVNPLSTLTIDPGKILSYSNGRIVLSQGVFDLTGVRYSDTTTLLNGNSKVNIQNGAFPMAALVMGAGNSIEGTGNVTGPIIMSGTSAECILNLNGTIFWNITMGGGTLALGNDLNLGNGILLSGDGVVQMNEYNLNLGKNKLIWNGSIYWQCTDSIINVDSTIDLEGTWTFKGVCEIKGNGEKFNFGSLGGIYVDSDSELTLNGLYLENIKEKSILCDESSALILNDVTWAQADDAMVTFTTGSIRFKNKVLMSGGRLFAYQSSSTSTISHQAQLCLDTNFTFSYDPLQGGSDLLEFETYNSRLVLRNATLHTTTTGMNLRKGTIVIKGDSYFYSETDSYEDANRDTVLINNGFVVGDGIDNENDCRFEIAVGSLLTIAHGGLVYNNLLPSSWFMENNFATLYVPRGVRLALNQGLPLRSGKLILSEKALLQQAQGAEITGAVFVQEEL